MNKLTLILTALIFSSALVQAADKGIPLQLKFKNPSGVYPSENGVNVKVYVLSSAGCILREENFSGQNVVNGGLSVILGSGAVTGSDPGFSLYQAYDNSLAKTGLSCVDANNNVILTGQTYTPTAADIRIIRVVTNVQSDNIVVNFNHRSVPFAIHSESVGGKDGADILVRNASTQLNQVNLEDLLADSTRFNNLKNYATSGVASSASSFSGSLAGDVSGNQATTVVNRIRGVNVSATAPTAGQVLQYNGAQYVPTTLASGAVTSVAGRTGAVVLASSDISGLGSAAGLNAGTAVGNLVQLDGTGKVPAALLPSASGSLAGDVSGTLAATTVVSVGGRTSSQISAAVADTTSATSANTAGTIVKRDASGNFNAGVISSTSNSTLNLYLFDTTNSIRIKAPFLSSNLVLTLPNSNGVSGQFLSTDGSGNLSWATAGGASGTVTSVTASAPLSSSGGATPNISLTQASASAPGYLSSSDWSAFDSKQAALGFTPLNPANNLSDVASAATARTNLGLGSAAGLSVGTTSGTVAAGNDSRITGALQSSAYNADVAPAASCTSSQTTYWNTVADEWACQAISFPASAVTSVAGRTGAVVLSSSDISGLGTAAVLNVGTASGNIPQLDGSGKVLSSVLPASVLTSVSDTTAATSANTASTIVKRDASGNFVVSAVSATSLSSTNHYLVSGANSINLKAPVGLASNLVLNLPGTNGTSGQVLQTDGAGNLSWGNVSSAGGAVNSVTASAPLSSSGGANPNISLTQASASAPGYLSSSDWSAFNSKQSALGFTPLNPANNLSDLVSPATARTNLGLGSAATLNAGTSTNNLVQLDAGQKIPVSTLPNTVIMASTALVGDVSGTVGANTIINVGGRTSAQISTSVGDTIAAASANTASTIVKRDASGNFVATGVSTTSVASANHYLTSGANAINLKAPAGLASNLVLNLPGNNGSNGNVLQTDGAGNLSWAAPAIASGTVTSVTASGPLSSSGGATPNISITQASASAQGYLSSSDWSAFNGKQSALGFTPLNPANNLSDVASASTARTNLGLGGAAILNVGTAASTVAAGNDSRITGALQTSSYNADVSPAASCTTSQTPYWNTIADAWACQTISFPADAVSSVAGRTGAVVLTSSDISGLGTAAELNVGTAVGNVVQLDGASRIPASTLPTTAVTTSTALAGDVTGTTGAMSVDKIRGIAVSGTPVVGQALVYNGTNWVPAYGVQQFSRKTADQTSTVTAVTGVTGLSVAVASGVTYKYKFQIMYTSSLATTGLRLGLTYPAVTTATGLANIASGADGTGAYFQGVLNTSGDSVVAANTPAIAPAVQFAVVEGVITPSAAGTLQLTFASETAGQTLTIKAGSFVEYSVVP